MKIKCCLVSQILASSKELPAWARCHIDRCEHCRREADKYARLRSALKSTSGDHEKCNLSWDQMKSRLLEPDVQPAARNRSWTYASAVCLGLILMIGLIVFSIHSRRSQDVQRVAEVPKSAQRSVTPKPVTKPEIIKPDISQKYPGVAVKQTPKLKQPPPRVKTVAVRVVKHRHLPVIKHARPIKASDIDKGNNGGTVTAQSEKLQQMPEVPPEVSYQAGKLVGNVLIGISENARPTVVNRIGKSIKKLVSEES